MNTSTSARGRLTWLLFFGRSLGSAAYIAGATIGAIVAKELTGQAAFAGVPGALYLLGGAAERPPVAERARAISLVVLGGTVGAIAGPALVGPMGRVAEAFQRDPLAG